MLERITRDSADQRAGRAGRLGPGLAVRLWDQLDRLRPHREPDITRIDLAAPVLDVLAWGGSIETFEWFEAPQRDMLDGALALLRRIGAVDAAGLTSLGERLRVLPLHPRLGAVLVAGRGAVEVARACALLADGLRGRAVMGATTSSDVLPALDTWPQQAPPLRQAADQLLQIARQWPDTDRREHVTRPSCAARYWPGTPTASPGDARRARRACCSPRAPAPNWPGTAASAKSSGSSHSTWLAPPLGATPVCLPPARSSVSGCAPTHTSVEHTLTDQGQVRATRVTWYDALRLAEAAATPDPSAAASLLVRGLSVTASRRGHHATPRSPAFRRHRVDVPALVAQAAVGVRSVDDIDLAAHLPWELRTRLEREAPERLDVPSGRTAALDYREDGTVAASVKLQELFGLAETPRIGSRGEPVLLLLLAPNGRPVQTTRDLRSFWERTYPEVRKELRGRYPRHPWPDDPWTATPTARTKRKDRT